MKISVILPVFNGMKYLEASVLSVINQNISDYEFLICDDCSTDDSLDFLLGIQKKYPAKVSVIKNDVNLGLFKTLNRLIENTQAPLIHLWAQDDIMKENCLQNCVEFHEENPGISWSYHSLDYIDDAGTVIPFSKIDETPKIISTERYAHTSIRWGCIPGNISNVTLTRKHLNLTGMFNPDMVLSGDFELFTRLASISAVGRNTANLIYLRFDAEQLTRNYKSIGSRIKEDIAIHKTLLGLLSEDEKKQGLRYWKWKTQSSYFNDLLYLLSKKEFGESKKLLTILRQESNIIFLSLRWAITRFLRALKLDIIFYKKVLDS